MASTSNAPVLGPFRGGTQATVRQTGFSQTFTLTTSPQPLNDYAIAPTNILRCIYIEVTGTTASNAATVAYQPDAPMNVLSSINFQDSGGTPIVGPFDGYTLAVAMKYFGYAPFNGDPRNNSVYSATTGSGGTGGSFNIVFRIPVEAVNRTGVGSLPNTTTQSPFVLQATVNNIASIYSTAPTNPASVKVVYRLGGYWNGNNAGSSSSPEAFGTTQYINRATAGLGLNGAAQFQLPNNGLGNPIRNIMFLNYTTSSPARSDTAFPDPIQITFKGNNLRQYSQNLWKYDMAEMYELNGAIDTGSGLDTGVYVLPFTNDFSNAAGDEMGLGYLQTDIGDEIQLIGTWAASSTLFEVVNFMAVNGSLSQVQGQ